MGLVAPQHVGSSWTTDRTCVPCIGRRILNHCATREVPRYCSTVWALSRFWNGCLILFNEGWNQRKICDVLPFLTQTKKGKAELRTLSGSRSRGTWILNNKAKLPDGWVVRNSDLYCLYLDRYLYRQENVKRGLCVVLFRLQRQESTVFKHTDTGACLWCCSELCYLLCNPGSLA